MSLYDQFIHIRNEDMYTSMCVFLFHECGIDSWTFPIPYVEDMKENIKNMWNYAVKIRPEHEVKKFINTEAFQSIGIKAKL